MSHKLATMLGCLAILLWSLLAVLTVLSEPVPPFLLNGLTFLIAGLGCLAWTAITGRLSVLRQVPLKVVAFGTAGLFGYHALYFSALRLAPPAEATLVNYLWPLLVVLFAGLLLDEKLRFGHILGALVGFAGAILVIWGDSGFAGLGLGHVLALAAAVIWGLYSVISRRIGQMPTESVVLYCLATAALSFVVHWISEETLWPVSNIGWLAVIAMGIGPVGMAIFVWDIGMKHGDIRLLGAASYAAPVMSTLLLVLAGRAEVTPILGISVGLITLGAVLAMRASRRAGGKEAVTVSTAEAAVAKAKAKAKA